VTEAQFYQLLLYIFLALGVGCFLLLLFVTAPYGRHARRGWGPQLPSWAGWVIMESPAVALVSLFFVLGHGWRDPLSILFLGLWLLHYLYRSFVYPFLGSGKKQPMPLVIALFGCLFNLFNGYLQGRYLFHFAPPSTTILSASSHLWLGIVLFLLGFVIHVRADWKLLHLRQPGESTYHIPSGGLYEYISCPNYFGELVEWTGWAVATWSPAGLAFALWTAANLAPRARAHHQWYRRTFPGYPPARKALIPGAW